MKKVLLAFVAICMVFLSRAQLPSGSIAPNFTGTDINGETHTLYDYLDLGYQVIIDVSATWCGTCWNYHNSGTLEGIYNAHGPNADQTVMVLFIEGDGSTTNADLQGIGTNTQGDWVANTPYPIIDDASIASLYAAAFPTTFLICPNRVIIDSESIQPTETQILSFFDQASCAAASEVNDPALLSYDGLLSSCGEFDVFVTLQNMGTSVLTSCTLTATGADSPLIYNWSGNLAIYATAQVNMGSVSITSPSNLNIAVTSADNNTANNSTSAVLSLAAPSTTQVIVEMMTDNWPMETTWDIQNDMGQIVASGGPYGSGSGPVAPVAVYETHFLPSTGCYTFNYYDAYGDGMHGTQWGATYIDGYIKVYGMQNGNYMSPFFTYQGTIDVETAAGKANVNTTVGINENEFNSSFNAFPNPTSGMTTFNYTLSQESLVNIEVIDMFGSRVMSQYIGNQSAGNYRSQLDLSNLSNGLYLVTININGAVSTVRMAKSQ